MGRDKKRHIIRTRPFEFNGKIFSKISIAMNHVNFDSMGNQRSSLAVVELVSLLREVLHETYEKLDGEKDGRTLFVYYFWYMGIKRHKLVFSIEGNSKTLNIITLYSEG